MKKAVVIVAGGSGKRMKSEMPKQFILLLGKPLLMYTIEQFFNFDSRMKIIVVLPSDQIKYWDSLCKEYKFDIAHEVIAGGKERFFSVKNGLSLIEEKCIVGVHDGVRPFVSLEVLKEAYENASKTGSAIPVIDVFESVRKVNALDGSSNGVNRSEYKLIQTPQVFKSSVLMEAYKQEFNECFTDDASVVEKNGFKVSLTSGNRENIKVTTPIDLVVAEAFVKIVK